MTAIRPQRSATRASVTVVVPTRKGADNLPHLIARLGEVREAHRLNLDLLIIDDDSQDGSVALVAARPEPWVRMVVRKDNRGLSAGVFDGLRHSRGDVLVCMDADQSHAPSVLPAMIAKLEAGADFVVGSRHADGGKTSDNSDFFRLLRSRLATLLARPLTTVRDPMAGFFALRRSTFAQGRDFNPAGRAIGLELMVRCRCERVVEVPIHVERPRFGESELTFAQHLLYLQHLRRLYIFKYGVWSQLAQFLVVGGLGTIVNLVVLTLLLAARLPARGAVGAAIFVAMTFNFVLNRRFSFSMARTGSWLRQFFRFVAASSLGTLINFGTTLFLLARMAGLRPQIGALAGIAAGTLFNFVTSRYLVFQARQPSDSGGHSTAS